MRNPPNLKLKLYIDYASQPARALIGFCRLNGIDHELKSVAMRKGEHMQEPFKTQVNPAKQIPAMQEIDESTGETFTLAESHAMMKYLAVSRDCPDHWYPSDLKDRARVDHYLDEHHNFLRRGVTHYIFKKLFAPTMTGRTFSDGELYYHLEQRTNALNLMERRLTRKRYLCGSEKSIADLSASCELD